MEARAEDFSCTLKACFFIWAYGPLRERRFQLYISYLILVFLETHKIKGSAK
jgi:hypothetical protein